MDITCHAVVEQNAVQELLPPSGGPWGGVRANDNFETFMEKIFGENFISQHKLSFPNDWLNIMNNFEKSKPMVKHNQDEPLAITLTFNFGKKFEKYCEKDIEDVIEQKGEFLGVSFDQGCLLISAHEVKKLFTPVIDQISQHLTQLLHKPQLSHIKYMVLVGGFGQCDLLQQRLLATFGGQCTVLMPYEAQLAVVRGAVMYGHQPQAIRARVATRTYGYGCSVRFKPGVHREEYKRIDSDGPYCSHIFSKIISVGESVTPGTKITESLTASDENYARGYTTQDILSSASPDPMYTTDPGVIQLAELKVIHDKNKPMEENGTSLEFEFGGTEMFITARSKATGEPVQTTIDFYSQ